MIAPAARKAMVRRANLRSITATAAGSPSCYDAA